MKYITLRFTLTCMHASVWTFKAPNSSVEIETYCLPSFVTVHELINVIARASDLYQYKTDSPRRVFYLLTSVLVNPFER